VRGVRLRFFTMRGLRRSNERMSTYVMVKMPVDSRKRNILMPIAPLLFRLLNGAAQQSVSLHNSAAVTGS
jgi:hypothetical protein